MVGILVSYWGGLFSGAMLVSGRVTVLHPWRLTANVGKNVKLATTTDLEAYIEIQPMKTTIGSESENNKDVYRFLNICLYDFICKVYCRYIYIYIYVHMYDFLFCKVWYCLWFKKTYKPPVICETLWNMGYPNIIHAISTGALQIWSINNSADPNTLHHSVACDQCSQSASSNHHLCLLDKKVTPGKTWNLIHISFHLSTDWSSSHLISPSPFLKLWSDFWPFVNYTPEV